MSTIQVNSLITRAATLIQDATNVRWPQAELLDWLNDGQREIVLLKPEASVKNQSVALTAGLSKQSIPADGIMLIDVTRNMGAAGTTPGDAIRVVSREVLDSQKPSWHSDANTTGKIQHYVFDPRDPKTFYVFPKAPDNSGLRSSGTYSQTGTTVTVTDDGSFPIIGAVGTKIVVTAKTVGSGASTWPIGEYTIAAKTDGSPDTFTFTAPTGTATGTLSYYAVDTSMQHYVETVYSAAPTDCVLGGVIQIDDIYANALLDYVLYRAYSKDAEYAQNGQLAVSSYTAFANSLGVKTQNELSRNPNLSATPFNPTVPGQARI